MKLNTANLFNFLLLVSFVYGVSVDPGYNMKQRNIATKPKLRNNWDETPETPITPLITMTGEKKIESESGNLKKPNIKFGEKLQTYVNRMRRFNNDSRKIRNTANKTKELYDLECLSCFSNSNTITNENDYCYLGLSQQKEKCSYGQQCYVEIKANSIKRGCITRKRMNITFVCRCPLCNDKSSDDPSFYNYDKVNDWEFDNKFISKPLLGVDIICKMCETKGTNVIADQTCRNGKNADYMVCGQNQVCFTNIDDETSFVSRGCINQPITNSFLIFCSKSLCNFNPYPNPRTSQIEKFNLGAPMNKVPVSKACNIKERLKIILLAYILLEIMLLDKQGIFKPFWDYETHS